MDRAARNFRRFKPHIAIIALRRVQVINHQVDRRAGARLDRLLGAAQYKMGAAAKFHDREIVAKGNWPETQLFEIGVGHCTSLTGIRTWPMATGGRWSGFLLIADRSSNLLNH